MLSPDPPRSAMTGWVSFNYNYGGGGDSTSKPCNGATQAMIDQARDVPSDAIATQLLLGMLDPAEDS